jgi:hypothetical protein
MSVARWSMKKSRQRCSNRPGELEIDQYIHINGDLELRMAILSPLLLELINALNWDWDLLS